MKKYILIAATVLITGCAGITFQKTDTGLTAAFKMKDVSQVSLYASVDGYAEHKAELIKNKWTVELPYADEMSYFITADGQQTLPDCDSKEFDDFGGQLCVYEVEK